MYSYSNTVIFFILSSIPKAGLIYSHILYTIEYILIIMLPYFAFCYLFLQHNKYILIYYIL